MKTIHLNEKKQHLIDRREKLIGRFNEAARARKSTSRLCTEIRWTNDFLESLERITAENNKKPDDPLRYAVSTLFLSECYKKLTADQDEQFFFITGAEVEGVFVLDQTAEFAHQRRSRLGVVADMFVQEQVGPCIACLFPDMVNDDRYPCPGTPAIADILQAIGALAVYAVDTVLMNRPRQWNYRRISLSDSGLDGGSMVPARHGCPMFAPDIHES